MKKNIFTLLLLSISLTCTNAPKVATISKENGLKYIGETKELLMGTLMKKIKENGTENALEFCNINAIPLTNSVSEKNNSFIKRVSDKNRNPINKATNDELKIINYYKKKLLEKNELEAIVENNKLYSPIVTNAMCLQCHGEIGKNIQPKTADKIKMLYPKDLATAYKENEIRGLFVVELKN